MERLVGKRWRALLSRLHGDEGGNVIVLYVAASVLLVAMVWALIGTGARAVQKETIQSSADAAAFSAAVIKAKGLNIIAFCNLIMALLLALVMLLRAIKYLLIAFATAVTICAAVPVIVNPLEPICVGLAPNLDNFAYSTYPNLEDKAERFIKGAMKGLSVTERAVAKITPILSLVEAYHIGTDDAYKRNFGARGGNLVTIAWPLLEPLPVKDASCQELAKNAAQYLKDIATLVVGKILSVVGIPKEVAGWFGSAVQGILSPLAGTLCGGGAAIPVEKAQTIYDCNKCQSAQNVQASEWIGNAGVTVNNQIGGTFKSPDQLGATCKLDYMPSWSCTKNAQEHICNGEDPARVWNWVQFQSCTIKTKENDTVTGESDWPPALTFTDDWKQKVNVRAYTVLPDTNMDARRQSVQVGERASQRGNTAPMVNAMMAMAESEWMAWNGHEDLWHMDWRARLVPFTIGPTPDGDTSAASEVPGGASGLVSHIVNDFFNKAGTASLKDQFLLH